MNKDTQIRFNNGIKISTQALQEFYDSLSNKFVKDYIIGTGKDSNILILSHNDLDGHGSSAVIDRFHITHTSNIHIHNIDGYSFDYSKIERKLFNADIIYITDLSLNKKQIDYIVEKSTCRIVWIDHHVSSFDVDVDSKRVFKFIRSEIGISAVALCWIFESLMERILPEFNFCYDLDKVLNLPRISNITEIPCCAGIKYISYYDTFHDNMDIRFTYGADTYNHHIISTEGQKFWDQIFSGDIGFINNIINKGDIIQSFLENDFKRIRKDQLIILKFKIINHLSNSEDVKTYDIAVMNINNFSMSFGNYLNQKNGCIRYYQKSDGSYSYGIYSDKNKETAIDCQLIAKHFGGGGHKNAAGWSSKQSIVNQWLRDKDDEIVIHIENHEK